MPKTLSLGFQEWQRVLTKSLADAYPFPESLRVLIQLHAAHSHSLVSWEYSISWRHQRWLSRLRITFIFMLCLKWQICFWANVKLWLSFILLRKTNAKVMYIRKQIKACLQGLKRWSLENFGLEAVSGCIFKTMTQRVLWIITNEDILHWDVNFIPKCLFLCIS